MDEERSSFIIDGFLYHDAALADRAKKERDGIAFIRRKTDMGNSEVVLQLYSNLIEQKFFDTQVGLGFLRELQQRLQDSPDMEGMEIPPIEVPEEMLLASLQEPEVTRTRDVVRPPVGPDRSDRLRLSLIVNVALICIVIAMFIITLTTNRPNILNYENAILDKYAGWEQELTERERQIRRREQELGITP